MVRRASIIFQLSQFLRHFLLSLRALSGGGWGFFSPPQRLNPCSQPMTPLICQSPVAREILMDTIPASAPRNAEKMRCAVDCWNKRAHMGVGKYYSI